MLDLLIENARICDGSGEPSYLGALSVRAGKIVAVGRAEEVAAEARTRIDAEGRVLAPGFIDPHTHFDAQLLWDGRAEPSLEHGITTVIPGNCSLSLAPLKKQHRELLGATFRQIEEMPAAAFDAGIDWSWESFEEYLAAIRPGLGINVAPLVGHSLLRLWVLGLEARERPSTDAEIEALQDLLRESLDAGAIGLSTSWVDIDHEYRPVPCRLAEHRELEALCEVLGERGATLQVVPEFWDVDLLSARIDILGELSRRFGITTTFSPLFESDASPDLVEKALERIAMQRERGGIVVPQMQVRPIDITFSLKETTAVFASKMSWFQMVAAPMDEKRRILADPKQRQQLIEEANNGVDPIALRVNYNDFVVARVAKEENRGLVGRGVAEIARERGCDAIDVVLDLSLEEDFETCFSALSLAHHDGAKIGAHLANELVSIGAGDGGAHVTRFATYGDTGLLLSEFVRAREALSLEHAVRKITAEVAQIWGLKGRGELKTGQAADLVLFDPETIARGPEIEAEDLPAPGYRYLRRASGVHAVFVNGELAYSESAGYSGAVSGEFAGAAAHV